MRGLTFTIGLSVLLSVGVVFGFVALRAQWTDADGRIVQTVGPTTDQYPSFNIGYRVPGSE